jgi:hypothetical protein
MARTSSLDEMEARQSKPIKAATPGLDAAQARQNAPVKPETSSLDAAKARQTNGLSVTEEVRAREAAKAQAASAKAAENKSEAKQNRDSRKLLRGLKQAEITGRVNNFVRDWANQNAAVNRAVNSRGQTVNVAELPGIGMLDVGSGKLLEGPLFRAPTNSVEIPPESATIPCIGLGLYTKSVTVSPNTPPVTQVWIGGGVVGGVFPTGITNSEGKFVASGGSGEVYVELTINQTTGELESVIIDEQSSTPSNTSTKFRYALGYYEYIDGTPEVTNYSCGSVDYAICRNWFTSTPPFYRVTFFRAGGLG